MSYKNILNASVPINLIKEGLLEIREALYENMTINDEVFRISNSIGRRILEAIPKTKMDRDLNNKPIKSGTIPFKIDETNITVNWTAKFFLSKNLSQIPINSANSNIPQRAIKVTVYVIDNKIDKDKLFESIQHEVFHFFERMKRLKEYNNIKNYTYAYNIIKTADVREYLTVPYIVAFIIYASFTFEHRAYANGAYNILMRSKDYDNDFENAIQKTQLFKLFISVKKYVSLLRNIPLDNQEMKEELFVYGLKRKRFLQISRITIIRMADTIGKIIKKAKKDYSAKHNIVEYAPSAFEFAISEETSRKRAERRLKAIRKHLIWTR